MSQSYVITLFSEDGNDNKEWRIKLSKSFNSFKKILKDKGHEPEEFFEGLNKLKPGLGVKSCKVCSPSAKQKHYSTGFRDGLNSVAVCKPRHALLGKLQAGLSFASYHKLNMTWFRNKICPSKNVIFAEWKKVCAETKDRWGIRPSPCRHGYEVSLPKTLVNAVHDSLGGDYSRLPGGKLPNTIITLSSGGSALMGGIGLQGGLK